ncbi:formylmethanofuran dehydrogenase subunit C [Methylopila turkensis]|uniref:Tungsten-containing formylmethanofuran dehydrogenase 2 subunit C n=1 Tax=Methylopila turkensis TaxID=1437816 RepID=A0A9W6JSC1_9HYPH|nr:formylmethanofuran dehydrogenase subunit C [Methylopila turkensis]GLK80693.1 tungsten-containing formylmethanofuran dehydrogenase 2 subunit C [Methylopila turkensis]
MSGIVLTPRGAFEARVDLTGALPGADLASLKIGYGGRRVALAELFEISGAADGRLTVAGGGVELDNVAAGLTDGEVVVEGDVGARLAQGATGGAVLVKGSAGDYAASELAGGKVTVEGDVGERLGAASAGARRGMSGGVVTVGGSAGVRAAERQRGGVIVVKGDTAEGAATDMIAGTLAVGGALGAKAGRGMKRGTLLLHSPEGLAAGFADAGEHDLVMLRVLVRRSAELAAFLGADATRARRFAGDLNAAGQGEALVFSR